MTIRGALVPAGTVDCATIATSALLQNDPVFRTDPIIPPSGIYTQTNAPVTFTSIWADTDYTVIPDSTTHNYVPLTTVCHNTNAAPSYVIGTTATLLPNQTLNFFVGYSYPSGWVRTQGGNVYAQTTIQSLVPNLIPASNTMFNLPGNGGFPGIVSMGGTSFDFSLTQGDNGASIVSKDGAGNDVNWLATNQAFFAAPVDIYTQFARRLSTQQIDPYTGVADLVKTDKPHVYQSGPLSIDAPLTVPAGAKIVVLVGGNMAINQPIAVTSGGFIAFIVNGNITVASTVGNVDRLDFTTMNVQGVYVASTPTTHTGTFRTVTTGDVATERRINLSGIFVADNFDLQRSLGTDNAQRPSEYFVFDPQLLFTMPDALRDLPYTWQEVAP